MRCGRQRVVRLVDAAELSGCQHTELIAVGIGQYDAIATDLEASGPKGDQPVDFRPPITVDRWDEVEALPVRAIPHAAGATGEHPTAQRG